MRRYTARSAAGSRTEARTGASRPPGHVAIIMDGNGRWARRRGLSRIAGHREGMEAAKRVVRACLDLGVRCLTLFAFSSENWDRPRSEVKGLFRLLKRFFREHTDELVRNDVRLRAIGRVSGLPEDVREELRKSESATAACSSLTLCLALNYGGQDEIVDAARRLAEEAVRGEKLPRSIDRPDLERCLYTAGMPAPDLLIRTGGEHRLSNFLLWQIAYCELWFSRVYWPDFGREHLLRALAAYARRERRYGGI